MHNMTPHDLIMQTFTIVSDLLMLRCSSFLVKPIITWHLLLQSGSKTDQQVIRSPSLVQSSTFGECTLSQIIVVCKVPIEVAVEIIYGDFRSILNCFFWPRGVSPIILKESTQRERDHLVTDNFHQICDLWIFVIVKRFISVRIPKNRQSFYHKT